MAVIFGRLFFTHTATSRPAAFRILRRARKSHNMAELSSQAAAADDRRLLTGKRDVYNGLVLRSVDFAGDIDEHAAVSLLRDSVKRWMADGVNGVWFEVNLKVGDSFPNILSQKLCDLKCEF